MDEISKVKLKTRVQTSLAKLAYVFNRRVKGVKPVYNLNYCGDGNVRHTLDVMRPSDKGVPCLIYFHGGGWTAYNKSVFRSTTKILASYGALVFNCNYRLAPEYNLKDMQSDVNAAVEFVRAHAAEYGGDADRIILAGDSSGAQLSALWLGKRIREGDPLADKIIGCVYFYGAFDLSVLPRLKFNNFAAYLQAALPQTMPNYREFLYEYSPINYICPQFPPTFISSGAVDPLNETQSVRYAEELKGLGVRVQTLIFPKENEKAKHRFITFTGNPAAKAAFAAYADFLKTL